MVPTDGVSGAPRASVGVEGHTSSPGGVVQPMWQGTCGGLQLRGAGAERWRTWRPPAVYGPRPGPRSPAHLTTPAAGGGVHCGVRPAER